MEDIVVKKQKAGWVAGYKGTLSKPCPSIVSAVRSLVEEYDKKHEDKFPLPKPPEPKQHPVKTWFEKLVQGKK